MLPAWPPGDGYVQVQDVAPQPDGTSKVLSKEAATKK